MPTYEYACKSCGEHVEVVQSFRDDPLTVCSACGGSLRKVFSPIGIAFKGSGFYRNDSRAGRRPGAGSAGEGSAASADKSSESSGANGGGVGSSSGGGSAAGG
ncbi:MAG: FmdB family zinc ribbon protein, partial [Acidimicrobiales bacterium]